MFPYRTLPRPPTGATWDLVVKDLDAGNREADVRDGGTGVVVAQQLQLGRTVSRVAATGRGEVGDNQWLRELSVGFTAKEGWDCRS